MGRLAIRRDTPPVVRVAVLQSVSCGLLAGAVFGGLTLWHDVGGLMSLIWSAEERWLALALFVFAVGSGFVTLAAATAVSFGPGADD
jgi:hypothetical protein